jgi:amino-acid N-acetyltransferase
LAPPWRIDLSEFRGRTLGIADRSEHLGQPEPLEALLKELERNQTRVLLLTTGVAELERLTDGVAVAPGADRFEVEVWRAFSRSPRVGVAVAPEAGFAHRCREIALRLGLSKLMWVDPEGGVRGSDGQRRSFVDLEELRRFRRDGTVPESPERRLLLGEIEAALDAGVAAVNLSTLAGLADELFTYSGSGTLFTRERYVHVRSLGLDDFDAAHHLVARGVEDGFLAPRPTEELERVLASGMGAFVEGRHLAGIGALLEHREAGAAEIAALYTLTRFAGEGVGGHLVRFAVERARDRGFASVFACTTAESVASFFEGQGFGRVAHEDLPPGKWRGYDPERRARVRCVQLDLR